MDLKLRKSMSEWTWNREVYEWTPGNGRWYWIHRRNIDFEGSLQLQGNLINALLAGLIATIKGSYSRRARKLTLKL